MTEETERAYRRALFVLERRDYTSAELQRKLMDKEFSEESISLAMDKLIEYGLIDDRRFTEQYLRCHYEQYSRRVLSMKLLKKGIQTELFDMVYSQMTSELDTNPEEEALRKAVCVAVRKAERKGYSKVCLPADEKNRIIASLYRKGFSVGLINSELNKTAESD